ncbi:MAG: hypothetical protein IKE66_11520 [Hyphomicrobium sp.]|nr:hypothetical protein [Hyphomicrobium sp.]
MKNEGDKPVSPDAVRKAARDARLAEQLRANLKRRKAAARSDAVRKQADSAAIGANPLPDMSDQTKTQDDGSAN